MEELEFLRIKKANYKKSGTVYHNDGGIFGKANKPNIIENLLKDISLKSTVR